jgi:hypothetical protein
VFAVRIRVCACVFMRVGMCECVHVYIPCVQTCQ